MLNTDCSTESPLLGNASPGLNVSVSGFLSQTLSVRTLPLLLCRVAVEVATDETVTVLH